MLSYGLYKMIQKEMNGKEECECMNEELEYIIGNAQS